MLEGWSEGQLRSYLRQQVLDGLQFPLSLPPAPPFAAPPAVDESGGAKAALMIPQVVPPSIMQRYLPADLIRVYDESLVRTFLNESESWQPCPRAGCTNAVHCVDPRRGGHGVVFDVVCECSYRFCWHCRREAHQPLPCAMLSAWQMACSELDEVEGATPRSSPRDQYASADSPRPPMHLGTRGPVASMAALTRPLTTLAGEVLLAPTIKSGTLAPPPIATPGKEDAEDLVANAELRATRVTTDRLLRQIETEATLKQNLLDVKAMLSVCFSPPIDVTARPGPAVEALMHRRRALRASHIAAHLLRRPLPSFRSVGYAIGEPISTNGAGGATAIKGMEPAAMAGGDAAGAEGGGVDASELLSLARSQQQLAFLLDCLDAMLAVPLPPHEPASIGAASHAANGGPAASADASAAAGGGVDSPAGARAGPSEDALRLDRCSGRRGRILLQHAKLLHHGHDELAILTAAAVSKRRQLKRVTRRLVQKRPVGAAVEVAPAALASPEGISYLEAAGNLLRGWQQKVWDAAQKGGTGSQTGSPAV